MNAINNTTIALQVKGIFASRNAAGEPLSKVLFNMAATPYVQGMFSEQDYRALISMIYSVRMDIVRLMPGQDDKPLMDRAKEGSLDANDTGRESDFEIERMAKLEDAMYCHAILSRYAETVADKAAADSEEAGKLEHDGGRYRISRSGRQFSGYLNDFYDDFLPDLAATAKAGTSWSIKIEQAKEVIFPRVSAQDALDNYMSYFEDENVTKVSHKAWDKLLGAFETYGRAIDQFELDSASYNAFDAAGRKEHASEFARICSEFKQEERNSQYWIARFMEPWALLCHTGVPHRLINSAEWRTAEAKRRTAEARVRLAQVQAEQLCLEAMNAEAEITNALIEARARTKALIARNVELTTPVVETIEAKEVQQEATVTPINNKPVAEGVRINPTVGSGFPSYAHR